MIFASNETVLAYSEMFKIRFRHAFQPRRRLSVAHKPETNACF